MPLAWLLSAGNAFAFSSDASSVVRTCDRWTARTNSPVVFTVTFSNGCANPLRGFYFTDQLPADLAVTPLAVTLNDIAITNYSFISGQPGDVYPGCIPSRWVLERPTGFLEMNPIYPGVLLRIQYSVTSPTPGSFALQGYSWVGYDGTSTNATFGYNEPTNQQTLTFVSEPPLALLALQLATNVLTLQLTSTAGASFIVQQSTNLSHWSPVATSTAPFCLTFTNSASPIPRFYRALWLP